MDVWGRVLQLDHFTCHPIPVTATMRHAMTKRAALRLASYFHVLGHRVKIRQHKSSAGVYYTVEFLATKK